MRVLLDTNVVVRCLPKVDATQNVNACESIKRLLRNGDELFLVPQVLYEFWVVATRPLEQNGLGLGFPEATRDLRQLQELFSLLRDERTIFDRWESLILQHGIEGKSSHDTRLVAAMQRHSLTHILTFNGTDFKRYPDIEVLDPAAVVTP